MGNSQQQNENLNKSDEDGVIEATELREELDLEREVFEVRESKSEEETKIYEAAKNFLQEKDGMLEIIVSSYEMIEKLEELSTDTDEAAGEQELKNIRNLKEMISKNCKTIKDAYEYLEEFTQIIASCNRLFWNFVEKLLYEDNSSEEISNEFDIFIEQEGSNINEAKKKLSLIKMPTFEELANQLNTICGSEVLAEVMEDWQDCELKLADIEELLHTKDQWAESIELVSKESEKEKIHEEKQESRNSYNLIRSNQTAVKEQLSSCGKSIKEHKMQMLRREYQLINEYSEKCKDYTEYTEELNQRYGLIAKKFFDSELIVNESCSIMNSCLEEYVIDFNNFNVTKQELISNYNQVIIELEKGEENITTSLFTEEKFYLESIEQLIKKTQTDVLALMEKKINTINELHENENRRNSTFESSTSNEGTFMRVRSVTENYSEINRPNLDTKIKSEEEEIKELIEEMSNDFDDEIKKQITFTHLSKHDLYLIREAIQRINTNNRMNTLKLLLFAHIISTAEFQKAHKPICNKHNKTIEFLNINNSNFLCAECLTIYGEKTSQYPLLETEAEIFDMIEDHLGYREQVIFYLKNKINNEILIYNKLFENNSKLKSNKAVARVDTVSNEILEEILYRLNILQEYVSHYKCAFEIFQSRERICNGTNEESNNCCINFLNQNFSLNSSNESVEFENESSMESANLGFTESIFTAAICLPQFKEYSEALLYELDKEYIVNDEINDNLRYKLEEHKEHLLLVFETFRNNFRSQYCDEAGNELNEENDEEEQLEEVKNDEQNEDEENLEEEEEEEIEDESGSNEISDNNQSSDLIEINTCLCKQMREEFIKQRNNKHSNLISYQHLLRIFIGQIFEKAKADYANNVTLQYQKEISDIKEKMNSCYETVEKQVEKIDLEYKNYEDILEGDIKNFNETYGNILSTHERTIKDLTTRFISIYEQNETQEIFGGEIQNYEFDRDLEERISAYQKNEFKISKNTFEEEENNSFGELRLKFPKSAVPYTNNSLSKLEWSNSSLEKAFNREMMNIDTSYYILDVFKDQYTNKIEKFEEDWNIECKKPKKIKLSNKCYTAEHFSTSISHPLFEISQTIVFNYARDLYENEQYTEQILEQMKIDADAENKRIWIERRLLVTSETKRLINFSNYFTEFLEQQKAYIEQELYPSIDQFILSNDKSWKCLKQSSEGEEENITDRLYLLSEEPEKYENEVTNRADALENWPFEIIENSDPDPLLVKAQQRKVQISEKLNKINAFEREKYGDCNQLLNLEEMLQENEFNFEVAQKEVKEKEEEFRQYSSEAEELYQELATASNEKVEIKAKFQEISKECKFLEEDIAEKTETLIKELDEEREQLRIYQQRKESVNRLYSIFNKNDLLNEFKEEELKLNEIAVYFSNFTVILEDETNILESVREEENLIELSNDTLADEKSILANKFVGIKLKKALELYLKEEFQEDPKKLENYLGNEFVKFASQISDLSLLTRSIEKIENPDNWKNLMSYEFYQICRKLIVCADEFKKNIHKRSILASIRRIIQSATIQTSVLSQLLLELQYFSQQLTENRSILEIVKESSSESDFYTNMFYGMLKICKESPPLACKLSDFTAENTFSSKLIENEKIVAMTQISYSKFFIVYEDLNNKEECGIADFDELINEEIRKIEDLEQNSSSSIQCLLEVNTNTLLVGTSAGTIYTLKLIRESDEIIIEKSERQIKISNSKICSIQKLSEKYIAATLEKSSYVWIIDIDRLLEGAKPLNEFKIEIKGVSSIDQIIAFNDNTFILLSENTKSIYYYNINRGAISSPLPEYDRKFCAQTIQLLDSCHFLCVGQYRADVVSVSEEGDIREVKSINFAPSLKITRVLAFYSSLHRLDIIVDIEEDTESKKQTKFRGILCYIKERQELDFVKEIADVFSEPEQILQIVPLNSETVVLQCPRNVLKISIK